jgi:hypothetical protein
MIPFGIHFNTPTTFFKNKCGQEPTSCDSCHKDILVKKTSLKMIIYILEESIRIVAIRETPINLIKTKRLARRVNLKKPSIILQKIITIRVDQKLMSVVSQPKIPSTFGVIMEKVIKMPYVWFLIAIS